MTTTMKDNDVDEDENVDEDEGEGKGAVKIFQHSKLFTYLTKCKSHFEKREKSKTLQRNRQHYLLFPSAL